MGLCVSCPLKISCKERMMHTILTGGVARDVYWPTGVDLGNYLGEILRQLLVTYITAGNSVGAPPKAWQTPNFQAFFWLYHISDDFVLCLQQQHSTAMVIYAHFVVLIKRLDWSWTIENWPNHLMSQVYESVDQSWRAWLRWPMEQVGWKP